MQCRFGIRDVLGLLFLPGNHDVCLRQVTLSVIWVQDSRGQGHCSFHRHYSLRPTQMHTHKCTEVRWIYKGDESEGFFEFQENKLLLREEEHYKKKEKEKKKTPCSFSYLYTETSPAPNAPTIRSVKTEGGGGRQRERERGESRGMENFKECNRWD